MTNGKVTTRFKPWYRFTTAQVIFAGYLTCICLVILLKNLNRGSSVFRMFDGLLHVDKLAHFLLFGWLTYLLSFAIRHRTIQVVTIRLPLAPVILLVATFMEECSQIVLESRTFSLLDMLANILGVACFGYIANSFTRKRRLITR